MKQRSRQRRKTPYSKTPGGPGFVSPEDQKQLSLDKANEVRNPMLGTDHLATAVRQSGHRCSTTI